MPLKVLSGMSLGLGRPWRSVRENPQNVYTRAIQTIVCLGHIARHRASRNLMLIAETLENPWSGCRRETREANKRAEGDAGEVLTVRSRRHSSSAGNARSHRIAPATWCLQPG